MLKLYQYEVCPFCCKVKAVLDYKKIPYEKIEVNPMTHEELEGVPGAVEYDKVPVLVDGNQVVFESNDIIRYLDQKFSNRSIVSQDETRRAQQEGWIRFADDELVQILPANIYRNIPEALHSFKYITKIGKFPRWKRYYLALGGAIAMTIVAKKGIKKRGITDPRKALQESLQKLSAGLSGKKFLGGDTPDVSDLVCAGVLSSVREMKVWPFIAAQKSIAEWYQRVRS